MMEISKLTFHIQNIWISALILLPNIIYILFPPKSVAVTSSRPSWWIIIIILENLGRLLVFALPLFYRLALDTNTKKIALVVMIISILIYYFCWARYLFMGQDNSLLLSNLLFIPVPMAIMPVIYFLAAGLLLDSNFIILSAIIFALGHIPESIICHIESS